MTVALAFLLAAADFSTEVHPILVARCTSCHNAALKQGGLALEAHADVLRSVKPGDSRASLLIQRVTGEKGPRMPLGSAPLTAKEIETLRSWIDGGAPAPAHDKPAAEPPPLRLESPPLPDTPEPHPVDKLVSAYLRSRKIAKPATVADAIFARRAYLDLWGLLPTPEQMDAFLADRGAGKRERLVAALLSDGEAYAHHWISFWNDHLRNDEGVVYHGERKSITPWLRQALAGNLPYDKFLQALLNPTAKSDPDGFLIGVNWRGDVSASQAPVLQAAQNSAQVFLGVNLKCNSCHDSFISRWKLADAYGLASYFSAAALEIYRCDAATGVKAATRFLYPELGGAAAGMADDAPLEVKRAAVAALFTMKENGRTPRTLVNRVWKVLFGRGIVEPVDDMDAAPWSRELLDWLAADFVSSGYDIHHLLRRIMTSDTYAFAANPEQPSIPYVFRGPHPRRLTAEQFLDNVSAITGEWRPLPQRGPGPVRYARDWQIKASPLGRALGRAIRDQVITERQTQPTTLQALELVNGGTLARILNRGARRMLGKLAPPPRPLFDSGMINSQTSDIDVDVAGAGKLWLKVEDVDSYDPLRTKAGWVGASFDGRPVKGPTQSYTFKGAKEPAAGLAAAIPSTLVLDVPRSARRFRARVGVDESSLASDINPRIRFFVYRAEPDPEELVPAEGEPPVPRASVAPKHLLARVYKHAFGREPSEAERKLLPARLSPDDLEDTLWAIFLSPEFQFIR